MGNYIGYLFGASVTTALGLGMASRAEIKPQGADIVITGMFLIALCLLLRVVFLQNEAMTDMSITATENQAENFIGTIRSTTELSQLEARVANLERLIDIDKTDDKLLKQKVCTLSNLKYYVEKMQKTYITWQEADKRYKQKNNLEQLLRKNK